MRIIDGSICGSCKHFEHECDFDNGCKEFCLHFDKEVVENFVDSEKIILECKGYE